ncbi:MAG: GNAT family N-acetyltransferase [Eubacteriales bacterium]|nr:GNAT family N-acetyltransferase [Eubacteriales bacterium]
MTEINNTKIIIRPAEVSDAEQLLKIYAPYVEKTVISFECEVPTIEEFEKRIRNTLKSYPYIVAEQERRILGYAYVGAFKARAAYNWSVETTIYLDKNVQKTGLGKRLYLALEDICKQMGILNMYACIGYPEVEDEYLTKNSADFHEHLGYRLVGEFKQCGYKFDRWYNMIWMEKMIGDHVSPQGNIKSFNEVVSFIDFDKY